METTANKMRQIDISSSSELSRLSVTPTATLLLKVALGHLRAGELELNLARLADRLIYFAQFAHSARRFDLLNELVEILIGLQLPEKYHPIANYYKGLVTYNMGRGDLNAALPLLYSSANDAPHAFRARSLMTLAIHRTRDNDPEGAMELSLEAYKLSIIGKIDLVSNYQSQKHIAVLKSLNGDKEGSLKLLRQISYIAGIVGRMFPPLWFDFQNSLALELSEAGESNEALCAIDSALRSPYAKFYPQWHETKREILAKDHRNPPFSMTFNIKKQRANQRKKNVFKLNQSSKPSGQVDNNPSRHAPARVIPFFLRPNPPAPIELDDIWLLRLKIQQIIWSPSTPKVVLERMLAAGEIINLDQEMS